MAINRVTSDAEAQALAELLNGDERVRPTAVVTTPAQSPTPYIDAERIAGDLGDLVDYVVQTGPHTWTFSNQMASLTQVYGGAGRAYPLGREWVEDPHRSPLRRPVALVGIVLLQVSRNFLGASRH